MSDLPVRRYNEKEVARLLKRASELQQSSQTMSRPSGLTLPELEDIAREAGLDVAALRQAASELDTVRPAAAHAGEKLAGGPLRIILERTLAFEASDSLFVNLVGSIENTFGGPGSIGQVGRTFTWHASRPNSGRTQQVRITVRAGQTTVRIEESFGSLVGALYGGVLGGVGGGVGLGAGPAIGFALGSAALAVALPVVTIGGTYAAVRFGYRTFVSNRRRALERLMQDLAGALSERPNQAITETDPARQ